MSFLSYFDLNRGARSRLGTLKALSEVAAAKLTEDQPSSNLMSAVEQVVMYVGTVLGVLITFLFRDGLKDFDPTKLSWSSFGAACLISMVIIPSVFAKVQVDSKVPFIVRFGLCVQNGVFWQALFTAAVKSVQ